MLVCISGLVHYTISAMPEVVSARTHEQKRASLRLCTPDFSPGELSTLVEVLGSEIEGKHPSFISLQRKIRGKHATNQGDAVGMVA